MASGQQQGGNVEMAQQLLRNAYESAIRFLPSKRPRGGEVDESYKASFKDTLVLIKLDPLGKNPDTMRINLFDMKERLPNDELHQEVQMFRQFVESPDTVTEFDLIGRVGYFQNKEQLEIVKSRIVKSTSLTKVKINAIWFKNMLDDNINMRLDIKELIDTVAKNRNIQVLNVYFKDLSDSNQLLQYSDYDDIFKFFPTLQKIILKLKGNIIKLEFENLLKSIVPSHCFEEAFFEFLRKIPRTFGVKDKILEFKGLNTLTEKEFRPIKLVFKELESSGDFPKIMLDKIGGTASRRRGKKPAKKKSSSAGAAGGIRPPSQLMLPSPTGDSGAGATGRTGPFTQSMQQRSPSDGGAGAAGGTVRLAGSKENPKLLPVRRRGAGAAGGTVGPPGSTTNPFGGGTDGVPRLKEQPALVRFLDERYRDIHEPRDGPPEEAFKHQGERNLSKGPASQYEGNSSEEEEGSLGSFIEHDTGVSEGEELEGLNTASRIGSLALSSKSSGDSPAALAARCILHVV
jgi:hypothetical protein